MNIGTRFALAGVLVTAAACASASSDPGNPYSRDLDERREIRIEIQNHNFSDATVWALVRDGQRQRLGVVTGKTDSVFTIPWRFSELLRLEFDMVAGPRCTTENLSVDPGDSIEMQIGIEMAQMADWCR